MKQFISEVVPLIDSDRSPQKPWRRHLSRPRRPFWGRQVGILDFTGDESKKKICTK